MEMKIRWLRKALKNISDIGEYIALDNPIAARKEIEKIEKSVNFLIDNSAMGKSGRVAETRELITGNYIIPYRVKGNEIQIIRVFDTAQKPVDKW